MPASIVSDGCSATTCSSLERTSTDRKLRQHDPAEILGGIAGPSNERFGDVDTVLTMATGASTSGALETCCPRTISGPLTNAVQLLVSSTQDRGQPIEATGYVIAPVVNVAQEFPCSS